MKLLFFQVFIVFEEKRERKAKEFTLIIPRYRTKSFQFFHQL